MKKYPGELRQLEFTDWFRPQRREFQLKALSDWHKTTNPVSLQNNVVYI